MLTTKERTLLKSFAQNIETIFQIGKNGLTDNLINDLSVALDARELIKLSVLKNAEFTAKDVIAELAGLLKAEPVQAIGNKIILYRKSMKSGVAHIM
ncbi:MAG: YhbY family RNA-binding protein [Clostridia bacterium]